MYKNEIRNYSTHAAYFALNAGPGPRRSKTQQQEALAKLSKMTCLGFVCILLVMHDLLGPIVILSLFSQKA